LQTPKQQSSRYYANRVFAASEHNTMQIILKDVKGV